MDEKAKAQKITEEAEDAALKKQIENLDFNTLSVPKSNRGEKEAQKLKLAVSKPSICSSNIERFKYFCKDYPSRDLFIDYNFRFMISSCLARRVWIGELKGNPVFGNDYHFFIAKPGLGKSLPSVTVRKILSSLVETKLDKGNNTLVELKLLNLGPDAITWEKLVHRAEQALDVVKARDGSMYSHRSTSFCLADEVEMLFSSETRKVVAFLNQGYDCDRFENDTYKHDVQEIKNICINFLGCTTPKVIKGLMKTDILNSGFTARTLFIFSDKKRKHPPVIKHNESQLNELEHLKKHLRVLCKIPPGPVKLSSEAEEWLDAWHEVNENPDRKVVRLNDSPLLEDYYARRKMHLVKMAMNFAFSDRVAECINIKDLIDADNLLNAAEPDMHKALAGNSENPMSALADNIKQYLTANGPTSKKKIYMLFFDESKDGVEGIVKVLDFLINTGQLRSQKVNDNEGVAINKNEKPETTDKTNTDDN